jgi:RNA polymerase sigma-70 factor, ECF subfamily
MNASNTNALTTNTHEIERLVSDCPRAWRSFHAEYTSVVNIAIRRVAGRFGRVLSSDAAEEIAAAFWLELLRRDKHKLRTFDPERGVALTSWIRLLATRTAYDHLRKARRRNEHSTPLCDVDPVCLAPDPEAATTTRQAAGRVMMLCQKLSARDQEFVKLYYQDEMEPEDIASELSIQTKTVYTKNHKIRARLQAWSAEAA